jgi:predicted RNA methylase
MIQNRGLYRNTIDKYYTNQSTVIECINYIKNNINIDKNDLIIEPSAGNGAFIENIKKLTNNYKFYDIEPENKEIIKQDFLSLNKEDIGEYKNIHIIGNPPFGKQASTAIKFIKKCCEFSNTISFILPKSFKKESMKRHFDEKIHLKFEKDIKEKSFLVNDTECDVPCVFQIWQKLEINREPIKKISPRNFKFVKINENPDIAFRRVGVYAGKITKDLENKSTQSHYFIKFMNNKTIDENIEELKKIKFEFNNTVGPRSISKYEIILEFNKYIG